MKRLFIFLLVLVNLSVYGQDVIGNRIISRQVLLLPADTTNNKATNSLSSINGVTFIKTPTKWLQIGTDTTFLSNRINLKLNISDTASMLTPYARTANLPTYSAGYGLTLGSNIFKADSFTVTSKAWHQKGIDSVQSNINLKRNIADTVANSTSSTTIGQTQKRVDSLAANYTFQNLTVDPTTPPSGKPWLNTTGNKFKVWMNGIAENVALESWASSQFRTGRYIYIDTDNPSATDTRGSLSKYSLTAPWKTITAGLNASMAGDVIYVRAGTYNETVSFSDAINASLGYPYGSASLPITFILDRATVNGGASASFSLGGNLKYQIISNGATIQNTGTTTDRHGSAAFVFGGNYVTASGTLNITSTEGDAVNYSGLSQSIWNNTNMTSTNGYAAYAAGQPFIDFYSCTFRSTASTAIFNASLVKLINSTVQGRLSAVDVSNQVPRFTIQNSTLTSDSGYVFSNTGALGGDGGTNYGYTYNSIINSYNGALTFAIGSNTFSYGFRFEQCKMTTNNSTSTNAFNLPSASGTQSLVKATNTVTNIPLFNAAYRTTSEGVKVIRESNTQTNDTTTFFNVKVGFGVSSFVGAEKVRVGGDLLSQRYIQTQQSAITSTATTTIDLSLGAVIPVTMAASITTLTLSNPQIGQYFLKLTQNATGGFTVTWPATVKWSGGVAPTLSAANKTDLIVLTWDGVNYFGQSTLNY